MKTKRFLLFAAIFAIVLTFFACTSDSPSELPDGEPSSNSSGGAVKLCGNVEYDDSVYRCEGGELIGKCRGTDFYPAYQVCNDGVIEDKNPLSSASMSSSSIPPSSVPSSSSSSSIQSSSSLSSSSRFCKSNDLGKGYDVIGSPYINWTEVNNIAVLDQDKMCQDDILELDRSGSAQQYGSFSGNTIKEFYSKRNESMKIGANLGVDIDIAFIFSAKFDVKFAMQTSSGSQQNQSLKYYYSQIRSYLYTGEDQIKSGSASAQNLSKYLTSSFISDLKSAKSAGQILDLYGSHVFIHYYKGGSLEANYTYRGSQSSLRFTSASQMEAAAKGSFAEIDAGINYGTSNSNEQEISELQNHMSFYYETYGGKTLKSTSPTQLGSEYGGWVTSIANNARTTGIKDFAQSFIPVWDLAQQVEGVASARINALKDEFKKRAEAQGAKLLAEEIPCTPSDNNSTHYCSNGGLREYGRVIDDGGNTYKTVVIGTQTWMAENLNYNVTDSKCYDCNKYGRHYDWATAMALPYSCNSSNCLSQISTKHKGICPAGYHIPTKDEWYNLFVYAGGSTSGRYLKAMVGWSNCSASSTNKCEDKYGFTALPGGYAQYYNSTSADNASYIGRWWSASQDGVNYAYYSGMLNNDEKYTQKSDEIKTRLFSVRCLKD
jgi:uncharacterized protein (TIGR02145 family)